MSKQQQKQTPVSKDAGVTTDQALSTIDKAAAEKAEADKATAKKAEADKVAAEKAESDKAAAEKAEADKVAAEKAEADKVAAEKAESDKAAAEKAEADKVAAEKANGIFLYNGRNYTLSDRMPSKLKVFGVLYSKEELLNNDDAMATLIIGNSPFIKKV